MRNTTWIDQEGTVHEQSMQTNEGVQKGLRTILTERGVATNGMKKDDMITALRSYDDFNGQVCWLKEICAEFQHECDFFPKFHPEFNWIERYWGKAKAHTKTMCDYTFEGLKKEVPVALDNIDVLTMRKFARKSFRYIDAYRVREGDPTEITPQLVEWNVKQYKSHRTIDRLLKLEEKLTMDDSDEEGAEGDLR